MFPTTPSPGACISRRLPLRRCWQARPPAGLLARAAPATTTADQAHNTPLAASTVPTPAPYQTLISVV